MTKVTESVFSAVKILLESGNNQVETARYLKLSNKIVGFIAKSETFEEYKALMYEFGQQKQQRKRAIEAKKAAEKKTEAAKVAEQVGAVPAAQIPAPVVQAPVQKPISMTVQATHYMETKLDVMIDLLKVMNNKLGAIIDDLYGTGSKGGDNHE